MAGHRAPVRPLKGKARAARLSREAENLTKPCAAGAAARVVPMPAVLDLTASAALFDMDGTLVDSTAVVEALWRDFCREHDVDETVLVPWSHGRRTPDTVRHF